MKKPSVQELVYNKLYPRPRQNDPASFLLHIQRCLVPEVREEVQRYFGRIDCLEAQYPGLDYTSAPHRRRLATFPWHRRLFRAFDDLALTSNEILALCTWEGTRAAKERYERDSGNEIECTTLHGVKAAREGHGPRAHFHAQPSEPLFKPFHGYRAPLHAPKRPRTKNIGQPREDEFDESVGFQLSAQLRAVADARDRGELVAFDDQWEQWIREALERNELDFEHVLATIRHDRDVQSLQTVESQQDREDDDDNDDEDDDGEFGHDDDTPDVEAVDSRQRTPTLSATSPVLASTTQTYDELHNMLDELQSNNNRLAADNAAMAHFLSRTRTETAR